MPHCLGRLVFVMWEVLGLPCSASNSCCLQAARQREYLEKTVDGLKRKLAKDSELHRTDNLRIMQVRSRGEIWPDGVACVWGSPAHRS